MACLFSAGVCLDASQTCKQCNFATLDDQGKMWRSQGRGTARPDTKGIFFAKVCHHSCAAAGDTVAHKLTATRSMSIHGQPTGSISANLHVQHYSTPQLGSAMPNMQVYSPFAYLLPDTFIIDILHNPVDTALIQGHKLRGH